MYWHLIRNDMRKSKFITATVAAFILAAALLASLAASLTVHLFGAIEHLMETARAIHFLQMHTGEVDERQLQAFADAQGNVEAYQLARFLNVDGADIFIGENSLAGSVQDNGFSTQNKTFDFLLNLDGEAVEPADGTVYVPLGYGKDGRAKLGDTLRVGGVSLTVAGFLRDSMMNYDIAGSKRFLVSENDLQALEKAGAMEYLIEFRLVDPSAFAAFQADYFAAGLPANGPPVISRPLLAMMNAVTDGMMIAVLVLVSLLVVAVAFLCIRFTLLAKIEEDYREIGVLKAIGLRAKSISRLYAAKYGVLAGSACGLGFLLCLPLGALLAKNIRLYMGGGGHVAAAPLAGALGAAFIFLVVLWYVKGVLRRFRGISAAQAVRFGAPQDAPKAAKGFRLSENRLFSRNGFLGVKDLLSRKKLYATLLAVLVMASFLLIVPQNIHHTISSKSFMAYLGVGESDISVHLAQTETDDVRQAATDISAALAADESVARYTVLSGMVFSMPAADGRIERLRVDLGEHTVFPVLYALGGPPVTGTDIALSSLNAEELGKALGDELTLLVDGAPKRLTVCGIYSDITAGGKTAKAAFTVKDADLMRVVIPVALGSGAAAETAARLQARFPYATVALAGEYVRQTFGGTLNAIQTASIAAAVAAVFVIVLVTLLFIKMLVTKDRYPIAIMKATGFTGAEIRKQYLTRAAAVAALGTGLGAVLANTLGELAGGLLLSALGATSFHFVVNPWFAHLLSPLLVAVCVLLAAALGVSDIRRLKISDHIKEA